MGDKVGFGYLEKLAGETVTVFKGGPHSDTGVLVAVKKDYLVLKTEDKGYVYYPFKHLKRVVGNTKSQGKTSNDITLEESAVRNFPKTFLELAQSLQLKPVHVNGGKHPSNQGYLIDAKSEFIVYSSEKEGLVFYRLDHVKSLSALEAEEGETHSSMDLVGNYSFADLLGIHLHKWATINEGPDKVEGVLVEVNDSFTVLVKHEEIIYVTNESIHFIKQKVHHGDGDKEKSSKDQNETNNETKDSNETNDNNETKEKSRSSAIKRMIIENLAKNTTMNK